MSRGDFGGQAKERSGWLIPLAVFLVTAVLTGLVLLYYLSPTPSELIEEQAAPTDGTTAVALSIGHLHFHIPANYIPYASTRKGGALDQLKLRALLPDMAGYTSGEAAAFAPDSTDARLVNLQMRAQAVLAEQDRLARIYLPQVNDSNGEQGPYGLTQYTFLPSSSYREEELFVGQTDKGPAVFRCTKPVSDAVGPDCLRDMPLADDVALTYRFKRMHLADWKDIDTRVRALIAAFTDK